MSSPSSASRRTARPASPSASPTISIKTWSAVDLVKAGAEALGGKGGGGRPDMAQAGGPDGTKAATRSPPSKPASALRKPQLQLAPAGCRVETLRRL